MPLHEVASKSAELRQELPAERAQLAREGQAFPRARVRESAEDLLDLVLLYRVGDLALREIAGVGTGSGKPLTEEAVRQRVAACPQGLERRLGKGVPAQALPEGTEGPGQLAAIPACGKKPVKWGWARRSSCALLSYEDASA